MKGRMAGSFSVEASFVLSFTVILICSLVYLGIYLHDRTVLRILSLHFLENSENMLSGMAGEAGRFREQGLLHGKELLPERVLSAEDAEALSLKFRTVAARATILTEIREAVFTFEGGRVALRCTADFRFPVGQSFREFLGWEDRIELEEEKAVGLRPSRILRIARAVVREEE